MKFNTLLLVGVILSCIGLIVSIGYIPLASPSLHDSSISIQSKFLEPPTQLLQQVSFTEFNYSTLMASLASHNISTNTASNVIPSYEQIYHTDKTQFITISEPAILLTLPMIVNSSRNSNNHNEVWKDISRIYNWVKTYIQYKNDSYLLLTQGINQRLHSPADIWQYPSQTLILGQGDCEDQALLLTSLLLSYSNESYYFECLLLQSSLGIGHVTPYIPIKSNLLTIMDPATGYYTTSESGNSTLASQTIKQEIANYLAFLSTQSEGSWRIIGAFSNNFDHAFPTTDTFSNWLLSRMSDE